MASQQKNPFADRNEDFIEYVQSCLPASHHHLLNQKVSDKHVMKIAEVMTEWEITLAEPLDLTMAEISDLNTEQRPQIRRRNVLKKWKDKKKHKATYGNLLDCCLEGGDTATADRICEVLAKSELDQKGSQQPSPHQQYKQQPSQPQQQYQHGPQQQYQYGVAPQEQNQQQLNPLQQGLSQQQSQQQQQQQGYQQAPPQQHQWNLPPVQQQQPFWNSPPNHPAHNPIVSPPQGSLPAVHGYQQNVPPKTFSSTADHMIQSSNLPQVSASRGYGSDPPIDDSVPLESLFAKVEADGPGEEKRITQSRAQERGSHKPHLRLDFDEYTISFVDPKPFRQEPREYYNMRSKKHGVAVIINNTSFLDHFEREGSRRDEYNLGQTFTYLGYRIMVCKNLTSDEILRFFTNLDARLEESNAQDAQRVANDSFVCCILSHGGEGDVIVGSDSKPVKLKDIERLTGQSKLLNAKPKIFFIQACRGKNPGEIPVERRVEADDTAPVYADFYICFATVSGDQAFRSERGSWFVMEVCKILCQDATADSLHTDFQLKLNKAVGTNPEYRHGEEGFASQTTCSNQLYKHVHFFHQ